MNEHLLCAECRSKTKNEQATYHRPWLAVHDAREVRLLPEPGMDLLRLHLDFGLV